MFELAQKVREFTLDGSPSVSQLVELQDLARKAKVKRTELDKMIADALATPLDQELPDPDAEDEVSEEVELVEDQTVEIEEDPVEAEPTEKEDPYARPDFDANRDVFEAELEKRREEQTSSFQREEIEFNRPEISFPEVKVDFGRQEPEEINPELIKAEEKEAQKKEEEFPEVEIEAPSIDPIPEQEINVSEEFEMPEPPQVEFEEQKVEFEEQKIEEFGSIEFEGVDQVEPLEPFAEEVILEDLEATVGDKPDDHMGNLEDIIKHRSKTIEDQVEFNPTPPQPQKQKQPRPKSKVQPRIAKKDLKDDQTILYFGIGSIAATAILGTFGIIVPILALSKSSEAYKESNAHPHRYHESSIQRVKTGRFLAMIGIIIGIIRVFSFIGGGF